MPKPSLQGYTIARDTTVRRGLLATSASFTCGACTTQARSKIRKGTDNANRLYPVLVCPSCAKVNAFRDEVGNFVRWESRSVLSG